MRSLLRHLHDVPFLVCPRAPVEQFRRFMGIAALLKTVDLWQRASLLDSPAYLRMPSFGFIPCMAPEIWKLLIGAAAIGALVLIAGLFVRVAGLLVSVCFIVLMLAERQFYGNHFYLLTLLVLLLSFTGTGRGGGKDRVVKYWPVSLIKLQICIMYFFAGATKLNIAFLSGGIIAGNLNPALFRYFPEARSWQGLYAGVALGTVLMEVSLAFMLFHPRWHRIAVAAGIPFHLLIATTMRGEDLGRLALFSLVVYASYLLFLKAHPIAADQ